MNRWDNLPFDEAVEDVSGGNHKTKQTQYLSSGSFAIVDQGKSLVAGYSNDSSVLCGAPLPVVIFGDHTRCFKFVDFPFGMGADGVKVLRPRGALDERFLYHFLRQLRLPDGGYDRHFKYLKRAKVPVPPLDRQRRIVAILDQAEMLRAQRRAAIQLLDKLASSIFFELFGDSRSNPRNWPVCRLGEVADVQGGLQVTSARGKLPVEVPYLRVANVFRGRLDLSEIKTIRATQAEVTRTTLQKDDLLVVEGHGNPDEVGRAALWAAAFEPCVHQNHLIRVRFQVEKILPVFGCAYLNSPGGRQHLLRSGKTTSGLNTISVSNVREAPVALPPLSVQRKFARGIELIDALRSAHQASLAQSDALFASLQHRAFRGEL